MSDMASGGSLLLAAAVVAPVLALALCLPRATRQAVPWLLMVAPLPALAAAAQALAGTLLVLELPALRLSLRLDEPGGMLLFAAALLWCIAGPAARGFLPSSRSGLRFVVCWLMTMTGSIGIFAAADLTGFYLFFALVSLPAYGLIAHDDTPAALRAGAVYVAFAVFGEALLLFGFALLAAGEPTGGTQIRDVLAALPASPWRTAAVGLTCAGFVFKIGLVPVHVWMPLSYTAAPLPAAAVLSGAAVKAGVIGLVRFLPFDDPGAADLLIGLGWISAFAGVALGLTQSNPRTVLAYSSVSQMGVIAALLGMELAAADGEIGRDAALYAAHHTLAKGALFLAIGAIGSSAVHPAKSTLVVAALVAFGLGGLPLTGGALAKLAAKPWFGHGFSGGLALASTVGTSLLMMHFLARLARGSGRAALHVPRPDVVWTWRIAAAAALFVPWGLLAAGGSDLASGLAPAALLASAWPVAAGVGLWFLLSRWSARLPAVPPGDIVGVLEGLLRCCSAIGGAFASVDLRLRAWPAAGLALLAVTLALIVAGATIS